MGRAQVLSGGACRSNAEWTVSWEEIQLNHRPANFCLRWHRRRVHHKGCVTWAVLTPVLYEETVGIMNLPMIGYNRRIILEA